MMAMDIPQTQNTAPVLEFRCLYTQDLRRKQKRWQDGRLKYHTFNKRVMVYDERSNFVGDTHWREDAELAEGDELELERGGIMVEVSEYVGKRDQDLSELVDKRVKDREERAAAKVANGSPSRFNTPLKPEAIPDASSLLRPQPLNAILRPTGHYGKAMASNVSPFEEKQRLMGGNGENGNGNGNDRPAKRLRRNDIAPSRSGYAQNLMGATLSLTSSKPTSTPIIRYEPVRITQSIQARGALAIDLTMSADEEERPRSVSKNTLRESDDLSRRPRKQETKPHKPSPATRSYASNLTGAALTLSRLEKIPSQIPNKRPQPAKKLIKSRPEEIQELSTSSSESNFIDIENVGKSKGQVSVQEKTKAQRSDTAKPSRLQAANHADSDLQARRNNNDTPMSRSNKSVDQDSSAARPMTLGVSMTSLRIKSRPRKMMMFMDRPSPRPKKSSGSTATVHLRPSAFSKYPPEEPVLSETSVQLDDSSVRDGGILQDIFNSSLPHAPSEPPSSSPDDNGIDHQTIDALLSRKPKAAVQETFVSKETEDQVMPHLKDIPRNKEAKFGRKASPVAGAIDTEKNDSKLELPPAVMEQLGPPFRKPPSLSPTDTDSDSPEENGKYLHTKSLNGEAGIQTAGASPNQSISEDPGMMTSKLYDIPKSSVNGLQQKGQKKPLPKHVTEYFQAATDHFRDMIKSPAGSSKLAGVEALPGQKDNQTAMPEFSKSSNNDQSLLNVAVKPLPKSPTDIGPQMQDEVDANEVGIETSKPAATSISISISTNTASCPAKAKLPNPATRGMSVQQLATNTLDTLVTPLIAMPPTAPPQNPKSDWSQAKHGAAPHSIGLATVGPWSRESFDLFGSWRPPGTERVSG